MEIEVEQMHQCFKDIHYVTNIPKYRSFQYRLLQRTIVTNISLYNWNMKESKICDRCEKEDETYIHLFIMCQKVKPFWLKVKEFMKEFSEESIVFSTDTVIANKLVLNPGNIKNFICLMAKQYIYKQRCLREKISYKGFIKQVCRVKAMEKYYATKNNRLKKYQVKWKETVESSCQENSTNIEDYIEEYFDH